MSAINTSRLLLSKLRGGDYTHPGDKRAVDLVIEKVKKIAPGTCNENCLDFGCGFGGTAGDFSAAGFTHLWGLDLDEAAIAFAKAHYPKISFVAADGSRIENHFDPNFFSLIYLFNVFYAIEDKDELLKNLAKSSKPGAILAIFDYTSKSGHTNHKDLAGKTMYPMVLETMKEQLEKSGWNLIELADLTQQYITWYQELLEKLSKEEQTLSKEFSQADITKVKTTFTTMLLWLKQSTLGGALLLAQKS